MKTPATLALIIALILCLSSCNADSDYCRSLHGTPSILCTDSPSAPPEQGTGGSGTNVLPCGALPCDDGEGGQLRDVGEACQGDDDTPLPELGGYACCHGLTCQGKKASTAGYCARTSATPAAPPDTCPKDLWVYECDGTYVPKSPLLSKTIVYTGRFTGPPPSAITAQGGVYAWMKIKFFATYPTVERGGEVYYFLNAKNCQSVGPWPGI